MIDWTKTEKRRSPRFEIDIPFSGFVSADGHQFQAKTRDISAWGVGVLVYDHLSIGAQVDIEISLSNIDDKFCLKGKVVWVKSMDKLDQYRTGISLVASHFNPIPLVLRMLQLKAASRLNSFRLPPS